MPQARQPETEWYNGREGRLVFSRRGGREGGVAEWVSCVNQTGWSNAPPAPSIVQTRALCPARLPACLELSSLAEKETLWLCRGGLRTSLAERGRDWGGGTVGGTSAKKGGTRKEEEEEEAAARVLFLPVSFPCLCLTHSFVSHA